MILAVCMSEYIYDPKVNQSTCISICLLCHLLVIQSLCLEISLLFLSVRLRLSSFKQQSYLIAVNC